MSTSTINPYKIDLAFRWQSVQLGSQFGIIEGYRPLQMALSTHSNGPQYFNNPDGGSSEFKIRIQALDDPPPGANEFTNLKLSVLGLKVGDANNHDIWVNPPEGNGKTTTNGANYLEFEELAGVGDDNTSYIQEHSFTASAYRGVTAQWGVHAVIGEELLVLRMNEGPWEVSFQLEVTAGEEIRTFIGDPEMNTGSQGGDVDGSQ